MPRCTKVAGLSAEGQVDLAGPSVTADLDLTDITLLPLQAYIAISHVSASTVGVPASRAGWSLHRATVVRGFPAVRGRRPGRHRNSGGATLVAWQALQASGLALAPGGLDIKEVALERPASIHHQPGHDDQLAGHAHISPGEESGTRSCRNATAGLPGSGRTVRIRDGALNLGISASSRSSAPIFMP